MNYENLYADTTSLLIKKIAAEFVCGIHLVENLDDEIYTRTANETGSIGGHFRHNLDFADGFLNGLKKGKIDYNRTRKRWAD